MASSHFSMPTDDPQSSSNSPSWIWKPADHSPTTKENDDNVDESWEVRAFEEDARSCLMMGGTWPPRSYPCTFCRREFRSAQALGGHMNIHRRDRARLRHFSSVSDYSTGPAYLSTSVIPSAPFHSSSTISDRSLCSTEHQMFEIPRSNAEAAGPLLKSYHTVQDQSFGTDLDQPEEMLSDDVPFGVDLELRLGH